MDEQLIELTRQVTILNERLPNHIEFTERNIADHESRIRSSEQHIAQLIPVIQITQELLVRQREMEKKLWMAYGGLATVVTLIEIITKTIGK